jgi:hypothetical protein
MPAHPGAALGAPGRPGLLVGDSSLDGARHRRWEGDRHDLATLTGDLEHAVAALLAEVLDVRPALLEEPQPEQAQHHDQRQVVGVR